MTVARTRSVHEDRLVWNPQAHYEFGEQCHFIILSIKSPDSDIVVSISRILEAAYIKFHSIYLLYGQYDALVRLWARPEQMGFLRDALVGSPEVATAVEFRAETVDYRWIVNPEPLTPRQSQTLRNKIELTSRSLYLGELPADPSIARGDDALRIHLHGVPTAVAHFPGAVPHLYIKAYAIITPLFRNREPSPNEVESLADRFSEALAEYVTVYSGQGFARYLVKYYAPDYADLLGIVLKLQRETHRMGLHMETYLIANQDASETDLIDVDYHPLPDNVRDLRSQISSEASALLGRMDANAIRTLDDLYEQIKIEHVVGTPAFGSLIGSFDALIRRDPVDLATRLLFVALLEGLLRTWFFQTISPHEHWDRLVRSAGHRTRALSLESDGAAVFDGANLLDRFSFADLVELVSVVERDEEVPVSIREKISDTFRPDRLREIAKLRNELAHGRALGHWDRSATLLGENAIADMRVAIHAAAETNRLDELVPTT